MINRERHSIWENWAKGGFGKEKGIKGEVASDQKIKKATLMEERERLSK